MTKQRAVVLQVVRDARRHLTANEVFERQNKLVRRLVLRPFIILCAIWEEARHIAEISSVSAARISLNELVKLAVRLAKLKPESLELTLRGLCPECK